MPGIYFGMYGNDIYPIILDTMILPLHRHYIASRSAFIGTKVLYFVYMGGESFEAPVVEPIESSRTMWCTPRLNETTPWVGKIWDVRKVENSDIHDFYIESSPKKMQDFAKFSMRKNWRPSKPQLQMTLDDCL